MKALKQTILDQITDDKFPAYGITIDRSGELNFYTEIEALNYNFKELKIFKGRYVLNAEKITVDEFYDQMLELEDDMALMEFLGLENLMIP